jgi:DNA end-binding protein Ku
VLAKRILNAVRRGERDPARLGVSRAPARPYWKGYLKLALVSCPIALYSAASSGERVAFRQINKKTGNRLRQQLVDEVTREPVESQDKGRGYEYSKSAYIQVEDDELDAIAIESNHTIEIDKFVPRAQIDERYLESPSRPLRVRKVTSPAQELAREEVLIPDNVPYSRRGATAA